MGAAPDLQPDEAGTPAPSQFARRSQPEDRRGHGHAELRRPPVELGAGALGFRFDADQQRRYRRRRRPRLRVVPAGVPDRRAPAVHAGHAALPQQRTKRVLPGRLAREIVADGQPGHPLRCLHSAHRRGQSPVELVSVPKGSCSSPARMAWAGPRASRPTITDIAPRLGFSATLPSRDGAARRLGAGLLSEQQERRGVHEEPAVHRELRAEHEHGRVRRRAEHVSEGWVARRGLREPTINRRAMSSAPT